MGMIHYRTLFISDVHLGTRASQAELLLDFLRETEADTIYLVGDIIDFWRIRRGAIWPQPHNDVLQKLLRKVRKGARIIFIPGNHDEGLRQYCGQHFGGIEIEHQALHTTVDGKRYLVIHGDEFDVVVRYARWLAFLGDRGYELALWTNHPLNFIRHHRYLVTESLDQQRCQIGEEGLGPAGLHLHQQRLAFMDAHAARLPHRLIAPGRRQAALIERMAGLMQHAHQRRGEVALVITRRDAHIVRRSAAEGMEAGVEPARRSLR